MFTPMPVIIACAVIILGIIIWALRRNNVSRGDEISVASSRTPDPQYPEPTIIRTNENSAKPFPHVARDLSVQEREQLKAMLASGRKIDAIKLAREWTGQGLAEAKNYVEALEAEGEIAKI